MRWRSPGSGWPPRRRSQSRLLQRDQQWTLISTTLDGPLSKFKFEGETEEVKLSAEEKLLLREARKKTKLE